MTIKYLPKEIGSISSICFTCSNMYAPHHPQGDLEHADWSLYLESLSLYLHEYLESCTDYIYIEGGYYLELPNSAQYLLCCNLFSFSIRLLALSSIFLRLSSLCFLVWSSVDPSMSIKHTGDVTTITELFNKGWAYSVFFDVASSNSVI